MSTKLQSMCEFPTSFSPCNIIFIGVDQGLSNPGSQPRLASQNTLTGLVKNLLLPLKII